MTLIVNLSDALHSVLMTLSPKRAANRELAQLIDQLAGLINTENTAPTYLQASEYVIAGATGSIQAKSSVDAGNADFYAATAASQSWGVNVNTIAGITETHTNATGKSHKVLTANLANAHDVGDGTTTIETYVTTTGAIAKVYGVPVKLNDTGTATASGTGGTSTVTLSKQNGVITTDAITTAAGAAHVITVTNTLVAATSRILVTLDKNSSAGTPVITSVTPGSGSFTVEISNLHASVAVDAALKVHFLVLP